MIPLYDGTDVQRLRKRSYKLWGTNVRLPVPVAMVQAVAFLVTLWVTFTVYAAVGVTFSSRTLAWFFAPAAGALWAARADQIEGRTVTQYVAARARYLVAPRVVWGDR